MPEGHSVHRLAELFRRHFAGQQLAASSPQGRFAEGAAQIDGWRLDRVEAFGKQMFLCFDGGAAGSVDPIWLRVHLGIYGMWRFAGPGLANAGRRSRSDTEHDEDGRPLPRGQVRLRLVTGDRVADLSGPTACSLHDPATMAALAAQIGPDPLRAHARPSRAWAKISASRSPIGILLMRQDVVGGIGNIYRAELLFRAGIDPHRPGNRIEPGEFQALWRDARMLMRAGMQTGTIVTTRPSHRPGSGVAVRRADRTYVAFRQAQPCRVCGTAIRMEPMATRKLYWCPVCQPA